MSEADQLAQRIAETLLQREGTGSAWALTIDEAREGYARVRMMVRADMLNGHGSAHGGMIFALADTAFAYACNSRNVSTVAQGATVSFLAPAREGDVLVAEAQEAALAGRNGVYHVSVKTEDGGVIAEFTGFSRAIGGSIIN